MCGWGRSVGVSDNYSKHYLEQQMLFFSPILANVT